MTRQAYRSAPPARGAARTARTEIISSRENRWLKSFRRALHGAETLEDGSIGIEGPRLVEEALRSGLEFTAILVAASAESELSRVAVPPSIPLLRTTDRLFAGVSDTQTPQGVAALVRPRRATFDDIVRGTPLVVLLAGVQDPGNVGTILRSAEAFGASGVIAARGTAHPYSPKVMRASAGSALRLPILEGAAPPVVLAQLRMARVRLCAASLRGTASPAEADLGGPLALLIGNEAGGLPEEVERTADVLVRIPVAATVDSLNAAVAASILLYEADRQRKRAGGD